MSPIWTWQVLILDISPYFLRSQPQVRPAMKGTFPSPSILYHGKSYFIYSTFLSLGSLELIDIEDQAGSKILHLGVGFQLPM
jgi:hypothetical protein